MLEEVKIAHRDIKIQNFIYCPLECILKLADFEISYDCQFSNTITLDI